MKRFSHLFAVSFLGLGLASSVSAQDILEQYYGNGVHAYFAGQNQRAEDHFNDVINAGSQDPRVHYFRGLTQIQSQGGMIEAGMANFEQAAQLEISGKTSGDVSKALSRIQGPTRIAIERIRAKARLAAKSQQFEAARNRPAQPGGPGIALPPSTSNGAGPVAPSSGANDPFGGGSGLNSGEPSPMPAPGENAPAPASSSPFDNAPAPDTSMPAPAGNNPFGDDPAPAAGGAPAVDPLNPFGT